MSNTSTNTSDQLVLVTGGSGFLGAHCIIGLLDAGYKVRTTVRTKSREADVIAMLKAGGITSTDRLSFAIADLMSNSGWTEAVSGCDYVLHVASPFPMLVPKDENELIVPAREGALRVLRASRDAGVKRVVLTSSFAAIGYGARPDGYVLTEKDWTDTTQDVGAYTKSKAIAERAAWDFIAKEGGALELSVVNPVGIFGPVLGADHSTSTQIVERLLNGDVPGLPKLSFGTVDVRDVVDMHLRAMTDPAAKGERFLAVNDGHSSLPEIAKLLKAKMPQNAKKVPSLVMPNWLVRVASWFDPSIRLVVPELGKVKITSNEKAKRVLGWKPRSNEESILATAESLVRLGVLKK